jgi:hypothetical protein
MSIKVRGLFFLLLFLSSIEQASLTQIARTLGHPHQLIAQRVKILLKLKSIEGHNEAATV